MNFGLYAMYAVRLHVLNIIRTLQLNFLFSDWPFIVSLYISFFISKPIDKHQNQKVTYKIKHISNNKQDGNGGESWKAKKA